MKTFYDSVLVENYGDVHISVDVQEWYEKAIHFDVVEYFEWMYKTFNKVIVFYNGEEIGGPPLNEHTMWLYEQGVSEEILDSFTFIEKSYAFFRACMDEGYEDGLVELVRYMYRNEIYDSRELSEDDLEQLDNDRAVMEFLRKEVDVVSIPDIMLRLDRMGLSRVSVSGGGDNECLEEVRIILDALQIAYIDVRNYIY
jgi:hypothetical protein